MAFLLPAMWAAAGSLVSAITTHAIHAKSNDKQHNKRNEQVTQLEKKLSEAIERIERTNKEKADTEAKFSNFQEAYRVEQIRKEKELNEEKEEIRKAQAERERLMENKHEQWELKQKEIIEAEKKHQRILAEEAKKGLMRSHDEFERKMALDRERLAKEEEFLSKARLEHERCLEKERKRFQQTQASYKRAMEKDRQRLVLERNTFAEAQKQWDIDRVVLKKNYDQLLTNLNEGYEKFRRDQRALEELLEKKMEDLMDEQKNLIDFEKEQKLRDLTETFLDYCKMYCNDPVKLTKETEAFQRKFRLQLNKVKNSMKTGDKSLPRLDVWKEGAVLDMKMLSYLYHRGVIKPEAIGAAVQMYRKDMGDLVSKFNASNALPCNVTELRAIENSFQEKSQQLLSFIDRALPEPASPHLAILAPTATESSILSPTRIECAVSGAGVSAAQREVHLESEFLTKTDGASQLPGSDNWARVADRSVTSEDRSDNFLPMLEHWTEGTVLNKKMLLYLRSQGGVSSNSVQCADLQDRRDPEQILSSINASTALPSTTEKVRAIESSFNNKLQEVDQLRDRALAGSVSKLVDYFSQLAAIQPSLIGEKKHQ